MRQPMNFLLIVTLLLPATALQAAEASIHLRSRVIEPPAAALDLHVAIDVLFAAHGVEKRHVVVQFDLNVHTYEKVTQIRNTDNGFTLETRQADAPREPTCSMTTLSFGSWRTR